MSSSASVPKKVEAALFFRLKERAFKECDAYSRAYADCCRGRLVSLAWACRGEAGELSTCMSRYTGRLEEVKQRWVGAGCPSQIDEPLWDKLLSGLS